jgi:hypothetical protein
VRAAGGPVIEVTPIVADGQVLASFTAHGLFGSDEGEVVRSGLVLTFTFSIELRRPSAVWLDPTIGSQTVASTVKFDNLTGVYQVSKLQDGHVTWSQRTGRDSDVRAWMTTFERVAIPVSDRLEPNTEYYVRVRMQSSPKRTFPLWPWSGDGGSGRADFTFIR